MSRNLVDTAISDEEKARLVVEDIEGPGGDAITVGGDAGADDLPQRILDATVSKYGKLDAKSFGTGFSWQFFKPFPTYLTVGSKRKEAPRVQLF